MTNGHKVTYVLIELNQRYSKTDLLLFIESLQYDGVESKNGKRKAA